ncbi:helix-turn-helix domain-containing protein [Nocardia colli]|uniref:helix-turn-helix domain-containing protein n=1 Tax=Nocardia colli TaxID=2545717 RepID=UPI00168D4FBC|nr:helix-turn-helix domain-containing protein [Nocardia colli]
MTLRGSAARGGGGRRNSAPVVNALKVLEAVAARGPGVTVRELGDALGMSAATTYDTVNTLVQQGYLTRLPDLSGFALGAKAAGLRGGIERPVVTVATPLPARVSALLGELRRTERGGIHLMGYQRGDAAVPAVLVLDADPDVPLVTADLLIRDPHHSAPGRLILAEHHRDPETRSRGFAVHLDPAQPLAGCLAVPVRGSDATLLAGLTLSTTAARLERPETLVRQLRPIGHRLGRELDAARTAADGASYSS